MGASGPCRGGPWGRGRGPLAGEAPPSSGRSRSRSRPGLFLPRVGSLRQSSVPTVRLRDHSRERRQLPEPPKQCKAPIATKPSGLRKILNKIRRSNSGASLGQEEQEVAREQRLSAASKASLQGWEVARGSFHPGSSLEDWDTDTVCRWFDSLGLYMYSSAVARHIQRGSQLVQLSSQELETKLGVQHPLHRKKVCLALLARQQGTSDPAGLLDHQWVTRWLEARGVTCQ